MLPVYKKKYLDTYCNCMHIKKTDDNDDDDNEEQNVLNSIAETT